MPNCPITRLFEMFADLIVRNASQLLTLRGPVPRKSPAMQDLGVLEDGALAAYRGRIVWVGPTVQLDDAVSPTDDVRWVDARGRVVLPGFVDAHTHVLYAGSRADEFAMRMRGVSYVEIMRAGGGILRTVRQTRTASDEEILRSTLTRLDWMLATGTTTVEVKTGYALDLPGELRLLRLVAELDRRHPTTVVPTLLAAHAVPDEYTDRREAFVRLVTNTIVPQAAALDIARFHDVFVETGVFSPEEAATMFEAGRRHGLRPRVHADEFTHSGGTQLAVRVRAASADHLAYATDEDIAALADAGVPAVLLPASSLMLRIGRHADGRRMVDAGVTVALGTDANPAVPCLSMQTVLALACALNGLSLEEAITAATVNAAYSLGLADMVGSLEPGKVADFLILNTSTYQDLGYRWTENLVAEVYKGGRQVVADGHPIYTQTSDKGSEP